MDAKLEFEVNLTEEDHSEKLKRLLEGVEGISRYEVNHASDTVVVETHLPSARIQEIVESLGNSAVIKGIGNVEDRGEKGSGQAEYILESSAVAQFTCGYPVIGVVRFIQMDPSTCLIDGTIDGLSPGLHGLHIHESGDLSRGCDSVGGHYNPKNYHHGGPQDKERHTGDLGNITASSCGRAAFRLFNDQVKIYEIIGRSLVVTSKEDDMGKGLTPSSSLDGDSGERLACGVIARSAGLFQNPKKICACSGKTLWDEREEAKKELKTPKL